MDIQINEATFYPIQSEESKHEPSTMDELWIDFGDYKTTIYNRYSIDGTPNDLRSLIGQKIIEVYESTIEIKLVLVSQFVIPPAPIHIGDK